MCMHCYTEIATGLQRTQPVCATPRETAISRTSGWFCGGCGHWHPWPRPGQS